MIVAAGLSPAWQQIMSFDGVRLGEVNRARQSVWCASGKVLNVGIALAHLGAEATTVAPLGGPAQLPIAHEFAAIGARSHWISTASATRVCTTLLEADGRTTELVENAGLLQTDELEAFVEAFRAAASGARLVVLTGSIPRNVPPDFFRRLIELAPCPAVLDIRGSELEVALSTRPLLVKPNREELGHTFGRPLETDAELTAAMLQLRDRGAQNVVVTQGPQAVWVASSEGICRLRPPSVETVNPIGSGDCLAAALAWQLAAGRPLVEAVQVGIAAGALNATTLLPGRIQAAEVLALAAAVRIEA